MSQQELLKLTAEALAGAGVEHMLTGSLVSSMQGEPRATHDIDIVVAMRSEDIDSVLTAFNEERFYRSREAISAAVAEGGMFNILDTHTGDKIDFWLLTDSAFDQSRFARRVTERLEGFTIEVSAPEDTILMKLHWARESGGASKHLHDAARVIELQGETLDRAHLHEWATRLGVRDLLEQLCDEHDMD